MQQPLRSSQPRPYLSHKQTDVPVAARASAHHTITALLEAAAPEDEGVMDRLLPLVYDKLRGMAHGYLLRERASPLMWVERHHDTKTPLVISKMT